MPSAVTVAGDFHSPYIPRTGIGVRANYIHFCTNISCKKMLHVSTLPFLLCLHCKQRLVSTLPRRPKDRIRLVDIRYNGTLGSQGRSPWWKCGTIYKNNSLNGWRFTPKWLRTKKLTSGIPDLKHQIQDWGERGMLQNSEACALTFRTHCM